MAWTGNFKYAEYKERAKFLLSYLKMRPEPFDKKKPFSKGYKSVLAFIVGSLCVCKDYRYVSDGTNKELKDIPNPNYNYIYKKKAHPEYKNLTSEHTIPVCVIVDYLLDTNNDSWTEKKLEKFLKIVSGVAVVTNDENKRLNDAGLRSKLPDGTTLADILNDETKHTIRYKVAKFDVTETNDGVKA
ncbi:MAG: hypothetical protein J1E59_09810 [Treponema sp.]|nr:hypothetical protein [Treponema sp.]